MPRLSPYPPLELDFDDLSPSGMRPAPAPGPGVDDRASETSTDKRNTVPPEFNLEEFAKEVMADAPPSDISLRPPALPAGLPEPPASEVRAVTDTAKTGPPPAGTDSLYPETSAVRSTHNPLHAELDELLAGGDYRAALVVAEEVLADEPDDIRAKAGVLRCHAALEKVYAAALGSLERVPKVAVAREEVPKLALDHRSGFILALIDGHSTLDTILDMSSMPRLDALRVLHELVQQEILALS